MADWLDKFEEERKRKEREHEEYQRKWEAGRPVREARAKAAKLVYDRHRQAIDSTFEMLTSYVNRANDLANAELVWKLEGTHGKLQKHHHTRELEINYYTDDENEHFVLYLKYSVPWRKGDPFKGLPPASYRLIIPVSVVRKEHVSEWVKWVATGEGDPSRWANIKIEDSYSPRSSGCIVLVSFCLMPIIYFLLK